MYSGQDQSIEFLVRALSLRPNWGFAWAELAIARSTSEENSSATLRALDRALAFAPSEPFIRRTVLKIGVSQWNRLDSHWRERVMAAARYLVAHEPRFAVGVAVSAGWEDQLRPLLTKENDIAYLDRRLEDEKIWGAVQ